jgi:hypothetical protein
MSIDQFDVDGYLAEMSDQDIVRFRAHAEECRQQAERCVSPLDKEAWLRMAADGTKLAESAEQWRNRW